MGEAVGIGGSESSGDQPTTSGPRIPILGSIDARSAAAGAIPWAATILALAFIMYLAYYTRSSTLSVRTVLDYDPWFWYRRADELIKNNMQIPRWDGLSFYPPGRPSEPYYGWPYTIAYMYKFLGPLTGMDLTGIAKWSTIIVAAATVVPAFLLGRQLSNKLGGVITALFAVLSPGLIGVSMGGYCDTDMIVTFYSFLTVYSILLSIKKPFGVKSIPYYLFAVLVNLAFVFTWGYGWIIQLFFIAMIPGLALFRMAEQVIHTKSTVLNLGDVKKDVLAILLPIAIIIIPVNLIGFIFGLGDVFSMTANGISFFTGNALIVNISVAELQKINLLSSEGISTIVDRIGLASSVSVMGIWPFISNIDVFVKLLLKLGQFYEGLQLVLPYPIAVLFPVIVILLPSPFFIIMFYKTYIKEKISIPEIFMFIWMVITFILINSGIRFSLIFASSTAVVSGYLFSNLPKYLKSDILKATLYGFLVLVCIIFISNAISTGYSGAGMSISDNWYNMLDWLKANADPKSQIVTWWDPGHIISGYTGLRVMADGAHCPPAVCQPYSHNDRIQDMGRAFSISDENESVNILRKYRQLTPEQCASDREYYGDKMPADACDPIPETYVIASGDLIGKYYWLSFFGTDTGRNFMQLSLTNVDQSQGILSYGGGQLSLLYKNGKWVPVLNFPDQGIRNVVVSDIVYYSGNSMIREKYNDTQAIDGMVFVDPSLRAAIFMDASIRDSVFTRMYFFDGEGLSHYKMVYSNPETKVFKVSW